MPDDDAFFAIVVVEEKEIRAWVVCRRMDDEGKDER